MRRAEQSATALDIIPVAIETKPNQQRYTHVGSQKRENKIAKFLWSGFGFVPNVSKVIAERKPGTRSDRDHTLLN
jgi:hypothetical protein